MLAIATYSRVYIYKHNGTTFTSEQTIYPESTSYTRLSWTEDHQYLTFADSYYPEVAYVYNYTGTSYQLIQSNGEFNKDYGKDLNYFSFGYGRKLLAASTERGLDLYSNFDAGDATLDQTLEPSLYIYTHEISNDGIYIILGAAWNSYSILKVYVNDEYKNCNIPYCTKCLNSTYCKHCNGLMNYFVDEETGAC